MPKRSAWARRMSARSAASAGAVSSVIISWRVLLRPLSMTAHASHPKSSFAPPVAKRIQRRRVFSLGAPFGRQSQPSIGRTHQRLPMTRPERSRKGRARGESGAGRISSSRSKAAPIARRWPRKAAGVPKEGILG